jgi:probable phosphomutase (TIGR03848 family)
MMATLILIRHGMTDVAGKQLSGWSPGIFLNDQGRAEVASLGQALESEPIRAVYSSPLERTIETARAIAAPHSLEVETRERVGEVRYGDWTGRWIKDIQGDPDWRHWNEHRAEARAPNGESMLEIQARVVDELLTIAACHGSETVAVVSHGDPIRAAIAYFLGVPLDLFLRIEIDPASMTKIQVESWGVRVLYVNRTG